MREGLSGDESVRFGPAGVGRVSGSARPASGGRGAHAGYGFLTAAPGPGAGGGNVGDHQLEVSVVAPSPIADDPFSGWLEQEPPCAARLLRRPMPSMGDRARFSVLLAHARDPRGLKGLAHLVEHLDLARGDDGERVALASAGVTLDAETDPTVTTYWVEGPSRAMPEAAAALLTRVFSASATTDAEVAAEREPLRVEKGLPRALPGWWSVDAVPRAPWGGTYELAQSLEAITASDVDRFRRTWNRPALATFVVVGDVEAVPASVFEGAVDGDCGALPTDERTVAPPNPGVRFEVRDDATSEVRVAWWVDQPDERDLALVRMFSWILSQRLDTELRHRRRVAYGCEPFVTPTDGRVSFGIEVEVGDAAVEQTRAVIEREVARLGSAVLLTEDEWEVDRAVALRLLTRPRTPAQVVEEVRPVVLARRGMRPAVPPVAPVAAGVDRAEFAAWAARATGPKRATWVVTRGFAGLRALDATGYALGSVALIGLGQLLLRRRAAAGTGSVTPIARPLDGGLVLAFLVAGIAGIAGPWLVALEGLLVRTAEGSGVGVVGQVAAANAVPTAVTAVVATAASLVPRDLSIADDRVVVRTFGAARWAVPARDVIAVRRERLVDLLRRGAVRFRAVPWPAPWSPGVSLQLRDGGVLLVHGPDAARFDGLGAPPI